MIDILVDDGVDDGEDGPLPSEEAIRQAVTTACVEVGFQHSPMLCIRFSDNETVQTLNREWRKKDAVTDVLSFPMQEMDEHESDESLGDIILATPFTITEADRLSQPVTDHMLHLIVHATLHLLGYDHIDDEDAKIMHKHERSAMNKLGLHDPYPDEDAIEDEFEDEDEQDV